MDRYTTVYARVNAKNASNVFPRGGTFRLDFKCDVSDFRDQDAVDRLRGHDSLVVGHRQVPQHAESRSQSVILLLVV